MIYVFIMYIFTGGNKMKKLTILLLTVILSVSMVVAGIGCKGEAAEVSEEAAEVSEEAAETVDSEVVEIKQFTWRPEDLEKWNKIYEEFNKEYPNIKLVNDPLPADTYWAVLETNGIGGELDTVFSIWQNRVANIDYFNRGFMIELTDLLPEFNNVPEGHQFNFKTDDGKVFGAPTSAQYTGMLYNKAIFRENNITIPVTWDEFIQVCEKLKSAGVTPLMFQGKDAWHIHYLFDLMNKPFLGGHDFISELKEGSYDFTNPKFVEALDRFKSLEPYFPTNFSGLGYTDAQNMMATGQIAMWPGCGSWEVFTLEDINPDLELGVFATPVASKGDPAFVTVFTDQALCIASNASEKEKEAALKFLKWMTTPEAGLLVNKYLGFFNCWGNDTFENEAMQEYAALAGPNGEFVVSDWAIILSDGNPGATELIQIGIQDLMNGSKTTRIGSDSLR